MNIYNATKFKAACTMGLDPDGRERIVAVLKGTYDLPREGTPPRMRDGLPLQPAAEQVPPTAADEFVGEPGLSAVMCESDFAPTKPRCDVLFNGSAYAPGGRPIPKVTVGLEVAGQMRKDIDVHGPRVWVSAMGATPSRPVAFTKMPFHYGTAFGGIDHNPTARTRSMPIPPIPSALDTTV